MDRLRLLDASLRAFDTLLPDLTPSLCLATRYRGSGCRSCVDACPAGALTIAPWLELDAEACLSCGACGAACRTGALAFPTRSGALRAAFRSTVAGGSTVAVLACRCVDPAQAAAATCVVPCLGAVSAADLIAAAAIGIVQVHLLSGDCRECPDAAAEAASHLAVSTAVNTLAALNEPLSVERSRLTGHQPRVTASPPVVTRRGLLGYLARGLERSVVEGVAPSEPERSIKTLHRQTAPPVAHRRLIDDLATIRSRSAGRAATLPASLPLATVTATSSCDGCGLCVRYCPHGALDLASSAPAADARRCTGCGLCAEVCPVSALRVGPAEI